VSLRREIFTDVSRHVFRVLWRSRLFLLLSPITISLAKATSAREPNISKGTQANEREVRERSAKRWLLANTDGKTQYITMKTAPPATALVHHENAMYPLVVFRFFLWCPM
jgi:hypothetical protein